MTEGTVLPVGRLWFAPLIFRGRALPAKTSPRTSQTTRAIRGRIRPGRQILNLPGPCPMTGASSFAPGIPRRWMLSCTFTRI